MSQDPVVFRNENYTALVEGDFLIFYHGKG